MPSSPSVRVRLKRLLEDPRASVKIRLSALAQLQKLGIPMVVLERLLKDQALPARLLAEVVTAYEAKRAIREWKRQKATNVLG